ncbi:MAG: electron transport complex subunit RsxG [Pseudomonadota bacterium]
MNWRAVTAKDSVVLAAYALVVGLAMLLAKYWTADRIDAHQQRILRQTLAEVLPAANYDAAPLNNKLTLPDDNRQRVLYPVTVDNQPYAVAITAVAPDGYAGDIEMLVGVSYDGQVTGVRVVSHHETPGLGDKIERAKSSWIISFDGTSVHDSTVWTVKKNGGDFDQFTGATITPRAVVRSVKQTLDWFIEHRQMIF